MLGPLRSKSRNCLVESEQETVLKLRGRDDAESTRPKFQSRDSDLLFGQVPTPDGVCDCAASRCQSIPYCRQKYTSRKAHTPNHSQRCECCLSHALPRPKWSTILGFFRICTFLMRAPQSRSCILAMKLSTGLHSSFLICFVLHVHYKSNHTTVRWCPALPS